MITDCLKEGFRLTNNNLQLVLIRIVVKLVNFIVMLIFMVVPLVGIIAHLGVDLASADKLLPLFISEPLEFISRYSGAILITLVALLFCFTITSLINLYVTGGVIGVLKRASSGSDYAFNLSLFFKEAGTHFTRLFWLLSLLLFISSLLLILMAAAAGAGIIAAQALSYSESFIGMFLSAFLTVTSIVVSILLFTTGFMFIFYAMMISVVEGKRAADSIKDTYVFLKSRPQAMLFSLILLGGVILVNGIFFGVKLPFSVVPVLAPLIHITIAIINMVFQSYMAVFVWSALITYYVEVTPQRDVIFHGVQASQAGPGDAEM